MVRKMITTLAAAAAILAPSVARAEAKTETVKIGTLAPAESPWGQVFKVWQKAVREKTKLPDGQKTAEGKDYSLDITFFWNGQQGDESAMVGKMKSGQLDGAAITAVGLGTIHRNILVLQLPGLFRTWDKLDNARNVLKGDFEKALTEAGFTLTGWGDVGLAHAMSKGFEVAGPDSLKGKNPYVWRDDPIVPTVYQVIGGVTPVPLGVPEVLPNLNTGAVNVVIAPALAAEQLQWASRLDNINDQTVATAIGALVLTNKRLDSLPADLRAVLTETGKVAGEALTRRIRKEDDAAFGRIKGKMTVHTPDAAEIEKWKSVFVQARQRLATGTFPPELVKRVEGLAN